MTEPSDYWSGREDLNYYREVERLAQRYCPNGRTLLDVGGGVLAGAKYLERFERFPVRVSIESYGEGGSIEGVAVVRSDFLEWSPPDEPFDLVLCLQVLEHQSDETVERFARKLFLCGHPVIVSVPYMWESGRCKSHPQDPVDEKKLHSWMGRDADQLTIVSEGAGRPSRIVAVYQ